MNGMLAALDAVEWPQDHPWTRSRDECAAAVRRDGLPTRREERWKYTDLGALYKNAYRPARPADAAGLDAATLEALEPADSGARRLVFVNGFLRGDLSTLGPGQTGVRIGTFAALARQSPESLPELQAGNSTGRAFTTLNNALIDDGVLIDLDDGVESPPLHLVFVASGDTPLISNVRVIVRAGRNARARIIEDYLGVRDCGVLTNALTELDLAEGSIIEHHRLQQEPLTSAHIGRVAAKLGSNATLHSDSVVFGAALTRIDVDVELAGRGALARLNGLFATRGQQHVDHHTVVDHQVGDTHSDELYRGILDERSRGVFNGKVVVRPDAQKITARQASNNLLLSRQAEIDTKPELEIYADDVKCAHGATVGELDQTALFYLRSRGVSEADARNLLTYAFASEVVEAIPLETLRRTVAKRFLGSSMAAELAAVTSTEN